MATSHTNDVTDVAYPERGDLPRSAPKDAGEVFDIVVRKGPISHDKMMRDQIYSMSSDEVFESLQALEDAGFVEREDGDIEEHGTTREVWYATPDDEDE